MKQKIYNFKSELGPSLEKLKDSIDDKFSYINTRLDQVECSIKKSVREEVNENIMNIKKSIINALKAQN